MDDAAEILEYDQLELRVSSLGSGGFRVQATGPDSSRATHDFTLPFDERDIELLVARIGRPRSRARSTRSASTDQAKQFGTELFDAVMSGGVRDVYRAARQFSQSRERGLRISLLLGDAPELMSLPWEYLYDRPGFVSQSVYSTLVRSLDLPNVRPPKELTFPLRIVAMVSDPHGYQELDHAAERHNLDQALSGLRSSGLVEVRWLDRATPAELHKAIRTRDDVHVLHYIGHGVYDERTEDGLLIMENEQGGPLEMTGEELCWLLRDELSLRLAVLNSCEGARTSAADPFSGVASGLVEAGIPAVVGMQFEITDTAAISFAESLYSALAQGYPVDAAVATARVAVWAGGHGAEFGTPVLFLRGSARLFDVSSPPEMPRIPAAQIPEEPPVPKGPQIPVAPVTETPGERQPGRRGRRQWAVLVGAIASACLLIIAAVLVLPRLLDGRGADTSCGAITADFTTQSIAPNVARINDAGGTFDVGDGTLRITAPGGANVRTDMQSRITAPYLSVPVRGDFTVETQVDANPKIPYQAAGLLLFRDSNNYIRLERGFGDFDAIAFEFFQNGSHIKFNGPFTGEPAPTMATTTSTGLRLVRERDQVSAYWRDAASNGPWQRLSNTAPLTGDSSAGLTVLNTDPSQLPFTARYRTFTVTCATMIDGAGPTGHGPGLPVGQFVESARPGG